MMDLELIPGVHSYPWWDASSLQSTMHLHIHARTHTEAIYCTHPFTGMFWDVGRNRRHPTQTQGEHVKRREESKYGVNWGHWICEVAWPWNPGEFKSGREVVLGGRRGDTFGRRISLDNWLSGREIFCCRVQHRTFQDNQSAFTTSRFNVSLRDIFKKKTMFFKSKFHCRIDQTH